MKILVITHPQEDYLADNFIIGLKLLFGKQVWEYPLKEILYQGSDITQVRGKGFTYYRYLPRDIMQTLDYKELKDQIHQFDWVIFSSIYRQYEIFQSIFSRLPKGRTIVLDGEDKPNIFLYAGRFWKNPIYWFSVKPHQHFPYFKREITPKTYQSLYYKLVPERFFHSPCSLPKNVFPISFGIPDTKVLTAVPEKTKLFVEHIVDEEVSRRLGKPSRYVFENENAYYQDLQASQFGITTKRAGWDCLRHYELAANGCVLCFKNLTQKPKFCAPHDLIPNVNCLNYSHYEDLIHQIEKLSLSEYEKLLQNTLRWAQSKKSTAIVKKVLATVGFLF